MGATARRLLVRLLISWLLFISAACLADVNAEDYDAFWLWSGVRSQPVLDKAKTLYLLRGQIVANYNNKTHFINQGYGVIHHYDKQVWLVYRAHTLNWNEGIFDVLTKQLKQWQQANIQVIGIQIDFDVATDQLNDYLTFLTKVRQWLPKEYQLSITGLLDWSNNGDMAVINQLNAVVDEVVIQTYQGRHTITNYQQYLPKLQHLTIPFKIGLVQYGKWEVANDFLADSPYFKGYVVFLQNPTN